MPRTDRVSIRAIRRLCAAMHRVAEKVYRAANPVFPDRQANRHGCVNRQLAEDKTLSL